MHHDPAQGAGCDAEEVAIWRQRSAQIICGRVHVKNDMLINFTLGAFTGLENPWPGHVNLTPDSFLVYILHGTLHNFSALKLSHACEYFCVFYFRPLDKYFRLWYPNIVRNTFSEGPPCLIHTCI